MGNDARRRLGPAAPSRAVGQVLLVVCVAMFAGCGKRIFPRDGLVLGGHRVPYATLRDGRSAYGMYCVACHGEAGDGRGPAGVGLRPAPRDFRRGILRFASVPSGQLPVDADVERIVRRGLRGTAMRAWDVPDEDLHAIVQYVKTLAPRWRTERAGTPVIPTRDPWGGHDDAPAIARGEQLYHGLAQCWTCHPAYATRAEMSAHTLALQGAPLATFRDSLDAPVMQIADDGSRTLPPDFLRQPMKAGDTPEDLFRALACGVGGTAMPAWHDVLPDDDLWALAHYVHALAKARDTARADAIEAHARGL